MSTEKNLELVMELLDAMRAHDIRKGTSFYAEDSVLDMIPVRGVVRGPQGLAAAWGMAWTVPRSANRSSIRLSCVRGHSGWASPCAPTNSPMK